MGMDIRNGIKNYQNYINQDQYEANVLVDTLKSSAESHGFAKHSLNTTSVENFTAGKLGDQF
jgi:hypothetical protein